MEQEALERILKRAADAAKVVPDDLRAAAFQSAVALLSAAAGAPAVGPSPAESRGSAAGSTAKSAKRSRLPTKRSADSAPAPDERSRLMEIDRTRFPDMRDTLSVMERSLLLLRIARDELEITHLGPPVIADVLTKKFLIRTNRTTVSNALASATRFVDRVDAPGGGYGYQLMAAGETHLVEATAPKEPLQSSERKTPTPRPRRKRSAKAAPVKAEKREPKAAAAPAGRARNASRTPTTAVNGLIGEGYFSTARAIADIQEQLETKKGLRYKVTELSSVLTRLTRSGTLDRDRNATGQYEYKTPGA